MPRLSEMPDFLPAGEPDSPERRACALGTFTDWKANADFKRYLDVNHLSLAATQPEQPTMHPAARLEKARVNVT